MQLFLYRDTKDGTVHASGNQKVTGCRTKLKNATQFTQAGVEDFSDLMTFLDKVNCQNCQNYFTPKILKADVKAMKQKLKADKKGNSGYDNNQSMMNAEAERERQKQQSAPAPSTSAAPSPVQQSAPVAEPEPIPEPEPAVQAPDLDDSVLPQYEEWVPPSKKKEQAQPSNSNPLEVDDSLSQFMLGKQEDPTVAAFASDNSKNPNVLAEQQETNKTASNLMDDMLAQFAIPVTNANIPEPEKQNASTQDSDTMDDMLAQFAIPGTNANIPEPEKQNTSAQDSDTMDDMLAQFAIPGTNTNIPEPEKQNASIQDSDTMDSMLAKFTTPIADIPEQSMPDIQTTPKPVHITGIDDILAEFGQTPSEKEEETLDELFARFREEKKQNTKSETPALTDLGNLEVPQLNAPSAPVNSQTPVQPAVNKNLALLDDALELDEIAMAPKEENKEEEEDEYMSRVVNTRLEDYDDDDDDDYDDDDYYDDDDEEEYHGSIYAPSDDDEEEYHAPDNATSYRESERYEQPQAIKTTEKASPVTAEDIQAATVAITAAAAAITAAAAKAPASVPELDLPDLSGLGIPDVPELDIPSVPDLPGIPDVPSNPFEADANADIPEVPTLSSDDINPLQSAPMGYPSAYQQPVYQQPPVYGSQPVYPQPGSVYLQPQQPPVYPQPAPAPAVHTASSYGNAPVNSIQFQQLQQQPQQPVSQGIRVSTIEQKTAVPDAVRNAIAKTAAQSSENIFDQQGKKIEVATDITSALSQMGEDTSSFNKSRKEETEPVVQGYKEWKPKEDKKLANFKKGLHKKF